MNSPQVFYRAAVANDAWEMIGVHYAAVQAIDAGHYSDEVLFAWSPPPDERRRQWLASLIIQDSTLCTVAVSVQNKIVGFCMALPVQAQLKALYIHPNFAKKGIGQGLLQHIETRCRDFGLEALELNASYNAEGFYQRSGYEALDPVTQTLTEKMAMGATHMVKRFSQVA